MKINFKKALSLMLCLIMTVAVMAPAAAAESNPYPVVYLEGYGGALIWKSYSSELSGYRFAYDWRLSPYDIADELKAYIENVMAATGKDKVNLVGR